MDISSELIIHECVKTECSTKQKRTLSSLTFRGDSGLRDAWNYIDEEDFYTDHRIFISYYGNKIVGWALCVHEECCACEYIAMLYVSRKFRRMGVGSTLLNHCSEFIKNKDKIMVVFRESNPEFFDSCGV